MNWKIPLFKMYWDENDVIGVTDAIRSGMNWASGPLIQEFEQSIAEYVGSRFCLAFNSGTSALHAALIAHGIGHGDEVIVPSFTFIATTNAPRFIGARSVFADIEGDTYGLSPASVEEKITRKTRAILPIHYGGCPCRVRELREIADDYGILLIEDAAEALGASVNGKKVGTFGDSAMMSFCQNKIITTGEGGAIVTDSKNLYERMKLVRSHGRLETADYFSSTEISDYISLGYNFRMSNITAALGLSQIKKIDSIISMRRKDAAYYSHHLEKLTPLIKIPRSPKGYRHVYQLYSVLTEKRDLLMRHLEKNGIMTKIYFSPVHQTHYYREILKYHDSLPVTERVACNIVSLPFYPENPRTDMDCVISAIREFFGMC